jgi:AcrR family transcriptional regulator
MTPRQRNPRGSGPRLRNEIVDGAIALIDETNDPASLTLRGIARATGISAPSIYAHYSDLAAVNSAVLVRSFSQLEAAVTTAMSREDGPAVALLAGCAAYVQFGWDHRARYRLMFAAAGFAPNAVDTFTLIEQTIARCVDTGASTSTDPHGDTFLLWVALHGIATLERPSRSDYLRLGPLDRPAAVQVLARRIARLADGL